MISESVARKLSCPSKYAEVNGVKMHYREAGSGNAILLLHGVPTSSYIWRNVIPYLAPLGRCIAPDLIGFGLSDKPNIRYSIQDHLAYLEKFIEVLNLKNITLIMHGFGSIIGLHYAMQHEKNCQGIAFYEAFLRSFNDDISLPFQEQLIEFQNQTDMDPLIADGASFVDKMMPQSVMRQLTHEEMQQYREPFTQAGASKPILQYFKDLSPENGKSEAEKIITAYSTQLTHSTLPKLMLYSVPGFITTIATVIWAKENLPCLEIVEIGEELHLGQETYPKLIGETISVWLQSIEQNKRG
ncbi:MAG: haloalkane dehalogenase [Gammaproteobacteria bacterium]|nr:haloalkane dehalogenase [Gammaproteobacteria bacterium]